MNYSVANLWFRFIYVSWLSVTQPLSQGLQYIFDFTYDHESLILASIAMSGIFAVGCLAWVPFRVRRSGVNKILD